LVDERVTRRPLFELADGCRLRTVSRMANEGACMPSLASHNCARPVVWGSGTYGVLVGRVRARVRCEERLGVRLRAEERRLHGQRERVADRRLERALARVDAHERRRVRTLQLIGTA